MLENEKKSGIELPKKHPGAEAGRAAVRSVVGGIPFAGTFASEIMDRVLPDPQGADHDRWTRDVTLEVNALTGRGDEISECADKNVVSLSVGASAVAKFIVEQCPDGLGQRDYALSEIQEGILEISKVDILDSLGDLESYGLVETTSFLGAPDEYSLTQAGYEALDLPIMGWSPKGDARALALYIVSERKDFGPSELEGHFGWSKRRLNPALRIVADFIRVKRNPIQPDYVATWLSPSNAEFSQLRRFSADE